MNLCPSLPGIDLSLPGLEQLKAVEMEVSESIGKEKNEESSGTPTVSGLKTVDGSEFRQSPVEVGSFFPLFTRVLAPSKVVGLGISAINSSHCWDPPALDTVLKNGSKPTWCFGLGAVLETKKNSKNTNNLC